MGIKVIFLDVDGVLNEFDTVKQGVKNNGSNEVIDRDKIERLNQIIATTGAVCVLSSAWRLCVGTGVTVAQMRTMGFTGEVIDETPDHSYRANSLYGSPGTSRGDECQAWLDDNEHLEVESFLILDDEEDFPGMEHRRIRTVFFADSGEGGLQDRHVQHAINILNKLTWKD